MQLIEIDSTLEVKNLIGIKLYPKDIRRLSWSYTDGMYESIKLDGYPLIITGISEDRILLKFNNNRAGFLSLPDRWGYIKTWIELFQMYKESPVVIKSRFAMLED